MVIGGTKPSWRPVTTGVPLRSAVAQILFNIFINGVDDGAEQTLNKSAGDTKLEGVADAPEGCAVIQ